MLRHLPFIALALLLAACADGQPAATVPATLDAPAAETAAAPAALPEGEDGPSLGGDVPENYSPAFERDTVIGLN